MGNMSYCRFENTLADMRDCLNALENGLDAEELSEYEISALRNFADVAESIASRAQQIENVIEEYEQVTQ
jgi:phage tail tape-measure protein|tara:strand:+ start:50 stop:259 length:210 start_codon:yes stop_codon:yes gene_type:complete